MTDSWKYPDGQPESGFRSRVLSGFPNTRLLELGDLLDDVGEPLWVCGPTAAALHKFDGFTLEKPFHLLVERRRHVRRVRHIIHTTLTIDNIDRESAQGFPATSPARTLIDIAAVSDTKRLTAALDGALRDCLVTETFLHQRINELRTTGRHGIPRLLSVIEGREISRGAHSWLEREYLQLMSQASVPLPTPQVVLGRRGTKLIRVDFHFAGTKLIVEVLGYRSHRTTAQMRDDAERMNRLILDGFLPLQFTYQQVVQHPELVVATTLEALARAAAA